MKNTKLHYITYADLFSRLALLMRSGVTTGDGLVILAEEETDQEYVQILKDMSQLMEEGKSLSEALSAADCFPSHAIGMIQIAEQVGHTEETLFSLSNYYENRARMSQNIRNSLTSPLILILVMLAIIVILISKVLPVFDEVYRSFGGSLSGLAGRLVLLGDLINNNLPFIGIILGLIFVLSAAIFLIPNTSDAVKRFFIRTFGDHGVLRKTNNAYFAQALSIALASGLPIEEGVSFAADLFSDCPPAELRCKHCLKLIEDGTELVSALREADLLTPSSCRMLSIGMRTGSADSAIEQIASRMSDEAEEALAASVARIEPAMVIIASVMVGTILLSVLLPLVNIMKAIG